MSLWAGEQLSAQFELVLLESEERVDNPLWRKTSHWFSIHQNNSSVNEHVMPGCVLCFWSLLWQMVKSFVVRIKIGGHRPLCTMFPGYLTDFIPLSGCQCGTLRVLWDVSARKLQHCNSTVSTRPSVLSAEGALKKKPEFLHIVLGLFVLFYFFFVMNQKPFSMKHMK